MSFTERLRILIDVDSKNATTGIAGFKKSVAEADGFAGKLKAGVSSLGSTFKSFITSPQGAAVAIAAAGAAMTVAVSQAMDLSLAVGKLKDQTGLSAEAASRWIEVADEMGISADTVASLLTKLEQNLGKSPEAFKELGVQVKYAADGSTDANGTLLAVVDTLNKIKDPAARAAAAQKLLGKGWKEASELIAAGSDAVKKKLAEVAGSKIIDEKEIEQARKFRETIDNLKDVGEELVITLGQALIPVLNEVVPVLTDVAEGVADVVGVIEDVADAITSVTDALDVMPELLDADFLEDYKKGMDEAAIATVEMGDANKEAAQAAYELEAAQAVVDQRLKDVTRSAEYAEESLRNLQSQIAGDVSWNALQLNLLGIDEKLQAAAEGFADGSLDAQEYALTVERITLEAMQDITSFVADLDKVPREVISKILADFDPNDIPATIAALQAVVSQYTLSVAIKPVAQPWGVGYERKARGGRARGGVTLVGEEGPELVDLPQGSFVHTAGQTKGMLAGVGSSGGVVGATSGGATNVTVNVNVGPGADPVSVGRATADALAAYYRNGGSRP